ncbi:cache domain-containing protein [Oceanospirillum sp.]|uniref:sensor histidine kinase n=1 Tax=Oceanospirillum sp. TaxID=2021254 RepID=UPI003A9190C7
MSPTLKQAKRRWFMRSSIRIKILGLSLAPLALTLATLIGMTSYWVNSYSTDLLDRKVRADLSVAEGFLNILQQQDLINLKQLSLNQQLQESVELQKPARISQQLYNFKMLHRLDFVRIIPATKLSERVLKEPSLGQIASQVLAGNADAGLQLISPDELAFIDPLLIEQVRIRLLQTPMAESTERHFEKRGMFIRALHPINNAKGEMIALLDSGRLLNRNNNFVDEIRDLVYRPGTLPDGGLGTVTLFLDDVRISTNVPNNNLPSPSGIESTPTPASRAVGTRVSKDVYQKVLLRGESWVDRAFVVNDWYISAYNPVEDLAGKRIGMLYSGFLEKPYREIHNQTLLNLILAFVLVAVISVFLVLRSTGLITHPIRRIHSVVQAVKAGKRQRIGMMDTQDEFSELAEQFDTMLDLLEERNRQIQQAADVLEHKVESRTQSLQNKTRELEEHIRLLQATRAQLITKEKLAALGELTAGIAHEINNPAAVILGNMDLLQVTLGEHAADVEEEIDLIVQQVYRIRALVNNLLQYSRPGEYTQSMSPLDINQVVQDTLLLVRHTLEKQNLEVKLSLHAKCSTEANVQQLQQVLVNLVMNAANASQSFKSIHIRSHDWYEDKVLKGVVVEVEDSGMGIADEILPHIFDPFFTTRDNGTGLGLSVSYGIIRRYGGDIRVHSEQGRGSTFSVYLLQQARYNNSDQATTEQLLATLSEAQRKR